MEITVVSAQGLKKSSSLFSHRIRPFITLTTSSSHLYKTTVVVVVVDHQRGVNPTWGHKFDLSNLIDASSFFSHNNNSYIYLHLYTKRLLLGPRFLGWCGIPAADIAYGFSSTRHLSYRLRKKDGSRGHGVVNVVVKLETSIFQALRRGDAAGVQRLPEMNFGQVAMGIPIRTPQAVGDQGSVIV